MALCSSCKNQCCFPNFGVILRQQFLCFICIGLTLAEQEGVRVVDEDGVPTPEYREKLRDPEFRSKLEQANTTASLGWSTNIEITAPTGADYEGDDSDEEATTDEADVVVISDDEPVDSYSVVPVRLAKKEAIADVARMLPIIAEQFRGRLPEGWDVQWDSAKQRPYFQGPDPLHPDRIEMTWTEPPGTLPWIKATESDEPSSSSVGAASAPASYVDVAQDVPESFCSHGDRLREP